MATVLGVIATAVAAGGTSNWQTQGYIDGREKVMMDFFVSTTEASGTVIKMGRKLPAGAKVITVSVHTNAATGALTISVGDTANATRYASASTGPATAGVNSYSGCVDSTNGFYVIGTATNDDQIILTTGGASLAGAIIGCTTRYTTD